MASPRIVPTGVLGGQKGDKGDRGVVGPSGGPFPDLTGVTSGKVPQTTGGGGVEFVDLSASFADIELQQVGADGAVAFEKDGDRGVTSVLTQAEDTMRFRWTRGGPKDTVYVPGDWEENFLITRYDYGMSWEYPGFTQFNTACLGVGAMEPYTGKTGPYGPGWGGVIVAFNQGDTGAIWMTYRSDGPDLATQARGELAVQSYPGEDGGPLHFVTRGNSGWVWKTGVVGLEVQHTKLTGTGAFVLGGDEVGPAGQLTVLSRFAGTPTAVFYGRGDQTGDLTQWTNAVSGSLARIDKSGSFITKAQVGVGDLTAPASDAKLHVADFGGVRMRLQDTNGTTGGSTSFLQLGGALTLNTYGPTGTFTGTPFKLSAAGVGFNGAAPARPAGVAVTAAAIHAALVTLGLITA